MDNNKNSTETKFKLLNKILTSDTLLIAAIPIMAYLLIFAYDSGYFGVYNLPYQFMNFNLVNILIISSTIVLLFFLLFFWDNMVSDLLGIFPKVIRDRLGRIVLYIIFYLIFRFLYAKKYNNWLDWVIFFGAIAFYILLEFGIPLLAVKDKVSFMQKLEINDRKQREIRDGEQKGQKWENPFWRIANKVPEIILIGFIFFIAYNVGRFDALSQVQYQVVNTDPERVVLWSTNDYAICAPFDRQTNEVEQSYIILKFGENPYIEYKLEHLGHLKLTTLGSPNTSGTP